MTEPKEIAKGLSDDARYLVQTLPTDRLLTLPWGIIPGANELLDAGVMQRSADVPYGRSFTPLGLRIAALTDGAADE